MEKGIKLKNTRIVDKLVMAQCPDCLAKSSIEDWDNEFMQSSFANRKMRRRYKSLGSGTATDRGSKLVYICPKCKSVVEGYMIKVE